MVELVDSRCEGSPEWRKMRNNTIRPNGSESRVPPFPLFLYAPGIFQDQFMYYYVLGGRRVWSLNVTIVIQCPRDLIATAVLGWLTTARISDDTYQASSPAVRTPSPTGSYISLAFDYEPSKNDQWVREEREALLSKEERAAGALHVTENASDGGTRP
ncbi:hypothetical protein DFH09DRAFT_1087885 [Mycena vulgaris]|nr:hypothetical protein DFH09DRAFT_1087885 [Mycena vulgaris]